MAIVQVATIASSNANAPAPDADSELSDEAVASIAQEGWISFEIFTIPLRRLGSICRRADKEMSTIRVLKTGAKGEAFERAHRTFGLDGIYVFDLKIEVAMV